MPDLSVILCTHNPRPEPLRRTVRSIFEQTLPPDRWEFVLVDNGSHPPAVDVLGCDCDLRRLRIVREEQLGLIWARLRGIRESTGQVLVFVDDDNVAAPDYLERALEIPERAPHLGAWGAGWIVPDFETEPPPELTPLLPMLALRTAPATLWSNNFRDWTSIPWGAGLCASRETADAFVQLVAELGLHHVLGRRGLDHQLCGDDDLFSLAAVRIGKGFGVFAELQMTHLIAASRLTRRYFMRLVHDHALSHGILRYVVFGDRPARHTPARIGALALHGMRRGLFSMRCRWAEAAGGDRAARLIDAEPVPRLDTFANLLQSRPRPAGSY
jgi:glycosyltransferase involved in cell wall biosynthesis